MKAIKHIYTSKELKQYITSNNFNRSNFMWQTSTLYECWYGTVPSMSTWFLEEKKKTKYFNICSETSFIMYNILNICSTKKKNIKKYIKGKVVHKLL